MTANLEPRTPALPADRVMCADSLGRTLLEMAVPPAERRAGVLNRVPVLGRRGQLPDELRRLALAADAIEDAVPVAMIDHVDAEAVAAWIVDRYRTPAYPAVVLGSAHGAATHLAVACGAAWLPTSFTLTAPWPGGSAGDWRAAMAWGSKLSERILAANPAVTVRQVHDPVSRGPLCGATVSLQVRWKTLPEAYRSFLRSRLAPQGASIIVRDLRIWPVLDGPPGHSFQVGSPTTGWAAADHRMESHSFQQLLRRIGVDRWAAPVPAAPPKYAETAGEPGIDPELRRIAAETDRATHRILYGDAQVLSAGVADLWRAWLGTAGRDCVVGAGRMVDPWQAITMGAVPYWCESSSRSVAEAAELWLAGSEPFDTISVLPDPPGTRNDETAALRQWRSVAAFARRSGMVDGLVARRYPMLPPVAGYATSSLRNTLKPGPTAPPLPVEDAVRHLRDAGTALGLLVA